MAMLESAPRIHDVNYMSRCVDPHAKSTRYNVCECECVCVRVLINHESRVKSNQVTALWPPVPRVWTLFVVDSRVEPQIPMPALAIRYAASIFKLCCRGSILTRVRVVSGGLLR
jgi:hypothetical protein